MTRAFTALALLLFAAACGADGPSSADDAGPPTVPGEGSCTCIDPRPSVAAATCGCSGRVIWGCIDAPQSSGMCDMDPRGWIIGTDRITGCPRPGWSGGSGSSCLTGGFDAAAPDAPDSSVAPDAGATRD